MNPEVSIVAGLVILFASILYAIDYQEKWELTTHYHMKLSVQFLVPFTIGAYIFIQSLREYLQAKFGEDEDLNVYITEKQEQSGVETDFDVTAKNERNESQCNKVKVQEEPIASLENISEEMYDDALGHSEQITLVTAVNEMLTEDIKCQVETLC